MSEHAVTTSPGHDEHPVTYVSLGPFKMRREYFTVLIVLSVLTLAEVGITYLPMNRKIMGVLLIGMALTKAAFVGLYYMHLKYEKRSLLWLAAVPLPLAGIYAFGLMADAAGVLRALTVPWLKH